ncbi:MAG: hypothetical protein JRH06_08235 [Deltaproteobacteria bacterium]|nr:hypothetical protein [Deltaproteobacteria bacterium]MBW2137532.1 hypothetical protein [Deltaproteobacteria bacterium]
MTIEKKSRAFSLFLFLAFALMEPIPSASWALSDDSSGTRSQRSTDQQGPGPWYEGIRAEWGGHFKLRGMASRPDEASVYGRTGTETFYDGSTEARLKSTLFLGDWGYLETHYEAIISGGDTRSRGRELERIFPQLSRQGVLGGRAPEDDRRFMDLTKTIDEYDDHIIYHRLDRLSLTLLPGWGLVRIGRQAVTWGNGLLFNPMDMFNPFSPTDTERDYKTGDDMLVTQFTMFDLGELQLLIVPRREPWSGSVEEDQSSMAGKLHFARGASEFDIMAGSHYGDTVVGFGTRGYLKDAAARIDLLWSRLDGDRGKDSFLSIVANVDYSWVWWGRNVYGLVELYYNSLGRDSYGEAIRDPNISERIERGELFILGRLYLSGHLRVEAHPLFNLYLTVINNVKDPSGIIQPYALWDVRDDLQVTVGGTGYYGGTGTEYGGFELDGGGPLLKPSPSAYVRFTYFF